MSMTDKPRERLLDGDKQPCIVEQSICEEKEEQKNEDDEQGVSKTKSYNIAAINIIKEAKKKKEAVMKLFGESSTKQTQRIKEDSLYGRLKTWRLVHLIVKTGDNLKQEQFAMQLLELFNQIFISEGLSLYLQTYQVVSLGPDCGLIQMVKDSSTIDGMKSSLFQKYNVHFSLS